MSRAATSRRPRPLDHSDDEPDTLQWWIASDRAFRIKTFAVDHDFHIHGLAERGRISMGSFIDHLRRTIFGQSVRDEVFGKLRFKGGFWRGAAVLPGLDLPVRIDVFAGTGGPSEAQRTLFVQMRARFSTLRAAMQHPLFAEYRKVRSAVGEELDRSVPGALDDFEADYPNPPTPERVWDVASLYRVEVYGSPAVDFCFNHRVRWAYDHQLNVLVKDWRVTEVASEG